MKERRAKEDVRAYQAKFMHEWKYGLKDYDALLAAQGGGCAVCGSVLPQKGRKRPHVDHDHETGEVRGILCHNCNRALGAVGDSVERLDQLKRYILKSSRSLACEELGVDETSAGLCPCATSAN